MRFGESFSKARGVGKDRGVGGAGASEPDGFSPDPEMERVLQDFRSSVHAWSEAVYRRPRLVEVAPRRMAWRTAAGWALASVLVLGGAGGGFLGYRHEQQQGRIAAARAVEQHRQVQEERAREAERELAQVDNDVSREVPSALEPLGQLMTPDESQ